MALLFAPAEALAFSLEGLDIITLRTTIRLMGSTFEPKPELNRTIGRR